jgi:hypothetical protein
MPKGGVSRVSRLASSVCNYTRKVPRPPVDGRNVGSLGTGEVVTAVAVGDVVARVVDGMSPRSDVHASQTTTTAVFAPPLPTTATHPRADHRPSHPDDVLAMHQSLRRPQLPFKSDLRNHQAIMQPRLYDCLMVTQITLKTESPHGLLSYQALVQQLFRKSVPGRNRTRGVPD